MSAVSLDDQRMVAPGLHRVRARRENRPLASCRTVEARPCSGRRARVHRAAEDLADHLVAEADAEDRHRGPRSARTAASEMPASGGVQGPGEITMRARRQRRDRVERRCASLRRPPAVGARARSM